ncbi:DUF3685 domain-containing protein [Prochlorococcus sp. MIT 1300]|uniref:DUF3685 domain-containing protein n=1 Tax=Prochlorococcus sp. MIT 1300 TaxID=3096218 RepID=UPI002A758684|nr:DUF3685 domain-containing protein [Prochlorococcus sp. MIT 1300]
MAKSESNQVLLLASDLLGESLALQLNNSECDIQVFLNRDQLTHQPALIIWSIESIEAPNAIQFELKQLKRSWNSTPVLLLIPSQVRLNSLELLELDCPGLLQAADLETLKEAISTLLGGGRVVSLQSEEPRKNILNTPAMGVGQWLLISGLQQINNDLQLISNILNEPHQRIHGEFILKGRKRELTAAKALLLWLWGPLQGSTNPSNANFIAQKTPGQGLGLDLRDALSLGTDGTTITITERNGAAVWTAIRDRLQQTINRGVENATGNVLALEGLNPLKQKELLLALLSQLNKLIEKLGQENVPEELLCETWISLQRELKEEALRNITGAYVRLPKNGELTAVAEELLTISDLFQEDEELPNSKFLVDPLLLNKPVLFEGQLIAPDDPRALLQIEVLVSNWLVRTAELLSAEILAACGEWPELRRYLLNKELISTRELERVRNQLNSKARWTSLIQRPIQLYESKRLLYKIRNGKVEPLLITEPRDEELRQLGWWQQQVALLLEARDALAPQLQTLVQRFGDLMVVILTQVIGRSIGLVGRGIAQGMGRSLGRS